MVFLRIAFLALVLLPAAAHAQCRNQGALIGVQNLADLCSSSTARTNLGADSATNLTAGTLSMDRLSTGAKTVAIAFIIDGGGSTITTGVKGDIEIPFACTITAARVFLDQSGSIVVDIWKDTYANFPPTDADSITASAPPTVSSATKAEDSTLTGWTTSISAGNILRFNVDSITTATRATVSLTCVKT